MERLTKLERIYSYIERQRGYEDMTQVSLVVNGYHPSYDELTEFYRPLFSELVNDMNNMEFICTSDDINDPAEVGDFDYLASWLDHSTPFIYQRGSHPMYYPSRVIIFAKDCQITIDSDKPYAAVDPLNPNVRKIFDLSREERHDAFIDYLKSTDRPVIAEEVCKRYDKINQIIYETKRDLGYT